MRMPGMTGLELYHELVALGHRIPTVIITAHPEELTQARAREAADAARQSPNATAHESARR
jgi:FixJ family two-component response regulator